MQSLYNCVEDWITFFSTFTFSSTSNMQKFKSNLEKSSWSILLWTCFSHYSVHGITNDDYNKQTSLHDKTSIYIYWEYHEFLRVHAAKITQKRNHFVTYHASSINPTTNFLTSDERSAWNATTSSVKLSKRSGCLLMTSSWTWCSFSTFSESLVANEAWFNSLMTWKNQKRIQNNR